MPSARAAAIAVAYSANMAVVSRRQRGRLTLAHPCTVVADPFQVAPRDQTPTIHLG
jgi:hypothetical protein